MANDLDDLMSGGSKTFPFDNPGDSVVGTILSVTKRQQTDMQSGEPAFWSDGKPKFMFAIELQTELREDEMDDGIRTVNVRWKSQEAVQAAVRAAGSKNIELGGRLQLTFTHEGPKTQKGFNPPKFWAARYAPPNPTDGFMSGPGDVEAAKPLTQARNVDHQGNAQPTDAPDWAQPTVGARPAGGSTLDAFRGAQAAVSKEQAGF